MYIRFKKRLNKRNSHLNVMMVMLTMRLRELIRQLQWRFRWQRMHMAICWGKQSTHTPSLLSRSFSAIWSVLLCLNTIFIASVFLNTIYLCMYVHICIGKDLSTVCISLQHTPQMLLLLFPQMPLKFRFCYFLKYPCKRLPPQFVVSCALFNL
mgnify:CR=1 FL=1